MNLNNIKDYSINISQVNEAEWLGTLEHFSDSSIYQTTQYSRLSKGGKNLYQAIVKHGSKVIVASLIRIIELPIIKKGIAYIFWGPLTEVKNFQHNPENLLIALYLLRVELVDKRKLFLRIVPNGTYENPNFQDNLFIDAGFIRSIKDRNRRTILLDITPPLEELRKNFQQKWRNLLNKSERSNLEIIEGIEDNLFEEFLEIYSELIERKKFAEGVDVNMFRQVQQSLPMNLKMRIFICRFEKKPIAGLVGTAIGQTGIYLLGATNEVGMKLPGAYLLQWKMIGWLKDQGCRYYDLGGIDPEGSPGVYKFKLGLNGIELNYIGQFESKKNNLSKLIVNLVERFNNK